MIGKRVEWGETGPSNPGDYAKHPTAGWHAITPNGHGANLSRHDVTEHEDGTITVTPSIRVLSTPDAPGEHRTRGEREVWHGFLERGVWREC